MIPTNLSTDELERWMYIENPQFNNLLFNKVQELREMLDYGYLIGKEDGDKFGYDRGYEEGWSDGYSDLMDDMKGMK